jgi:hypothetical protein
MFPGNQHPKKGGTPMDHSTPLKTALRGLAATTLVGGALGLAACGDSDSGSDDGTGTLSVDVTDAPVDSAEEVVVRFDSVEIKPAGEDAQWQTFNFDSPKKIDLLAYQGDKSAKLLDGVEVESGDYAQIRLTGSQGEAGESTVVLEAGGEHNLFIPSFDQTGLKLTKGFSVPENGDADYTLDFDLKKSLHKTGEGRYILRPTVRLVDNAEVGHIAAEVDGMGNCPSGADDGPAIYVFEGSDVDADDVDGNEPEPVTTAMLKDGDKDSTYTGTAGFLTTGTYTVAFTCQGANDAIDADDDLAFQGSENMDVQAGQTVTYSHTVTAQ